MLLTSIGTETRRAVLLVRMTPLSLG